MTDNIDNSNVSDAEIQAALELYRAVQERARAEKADVSTDVDMEDPSVAPSEPLYAPESDAEDVDGSASPLDTEDLSEGVETFPEGAAAVYEDADDVADEEDYSEELTAVQNADFVSWEILFPVDEHGRQLRGQAMGDELPILVITSLATGNKATLPLSALTARDLATVLQEVNDGFFEPEKPRERLRNYGKRIVEWHFAHKVLGTFSALFWITVIGYWLVMPLWGLVRMFGWN